MIFNTQNRSCHPERSEGSADRERPFPFAEFTLERSEGLRAAAHALRVTRCDCSHCQVQFAQIEPCLTNMFKEGSSVDPTNPHPLPLWPLPAGLRSPPRPRPQSQQPP